MGVMIGISTAPPAETAAGQHQFTGRESTGGSALTAAVKMFGPAATMQEFLKKILKWQAYVRGELKKCAIF